MKRTARKALKSLAGHTLPDSDRLLHLCSIPKFMSWKKSVGDCPGFKTRFELYDHVNRTVIENHPVDYLEFGVFKGESIKYWSELNQSPESRFFGFDTFTGLPEEWSAGHGHLLPAHAFTTGGETPRIQDPRVNFVPGLFQETLQGFLERYEGRENLIIHNDADLYSATLYTLATCDPIIKSGTVLLFDEFYSILHEFRAFMDYTRSFMKDYTVVGYAGDFSQVAVRIL